MPVDLLCLPILPVAVLCAALPPVHADSFRLPAAAGSKRRLYGVVP